MSGDPLTYLEGKAAPLLRANVDTDAIAPSRIRIASLTKHGFAQALFANWRFDDAGAEDPTFVLNTDTYRASVALVAGDNFGCGSSRETATWALRDYGIRAVVAPSFGSIFQANCYRNGILPLALSPAEHAEFITELYENAPEPRIVIDVAAGEVRAAGGPVHHFTLEPHARRLLLEGLDAIGETLMLREQIDSFRTRDQLLRPWIYSAGAAAQLG